jgi:RNA polymerase sigma factor (sigma-70 family)
MGMLAKRELADEVVQTTMLKAWRAASSFDPSRELAPWLYAIARRVAIDVYRREQRAAVPAELSDDQVAVVPLSFERTWEAWEVRSALGQLAAEEREVVRLARSTATRRSPSPCNKNAQAKNPRGASCCQETSAASTADFGASMYRPAQGAPATLSNVGPALASLTGSAGRRGT